MTKLSAGAVVVNFTEGRPLYLLLRAYRYWDFPKGAVEPGEDALAAARREVREETGLASLEFRWGEEYVETAPYAGGKTARYYLAHAPTMAVTLGINPTLGRPEHHEYRWFDYSVARQRLGPRVRSVLDWANRRIHERSVC